MNSATDEHATHSGRDLPVRRSGVSPIRDTSVVVRLLLIMVFTNMEPDFRNSVSRSSFRRRRCAAFSLAETMLAVFLCAGALTALYTAVGQSMRLVKMGRDSALANQVTEQRTSQFHAAPLWSTVTTITGATSLMGTAAAANANFPDYTESVTLSDYPSDGSTFTITRSPTGAIASSGSSLPSATRCVQLTVAVRWTSVGHLSRSRTAATVLTKKGV